MAQQRTESTRNMTPTQARAAFTQATRSFPPAEAKRIVAGAVRAARQGRSVQVRRAQARARFNAALTRGTGLQR